MVCKSFSVGKDNYLAIYIVEMENRMLIMTSIQKALSQNNLIKENKSGFNLSKTILVVLAKFSLTLLAFYVISKKITFNPADYLNKSNINYFILAIFLAFLLVFIQAFRWKNILNIFSTNSSFQQCFIAVLFGHLINNLVPTAAAGDLLRSYTLRYANIKRGKWKWLGAFFSEKYCAATSALFIASISFAGSVSKQIPIILVSFIVAMLLLLIILPIVGERIFSSLRFHRIQWLVDYIHKISILLTNTFKNKNGQRAFLASFFINLGMCVVFYTIALGVGVKIAFMQCLFVVPVFTLLATLPISFAGWGIRELSCVGLLSFFGVSSESAVVISVMYGLLFLLSSLPGIFVAYPFISSMRNLSQHR